MAESEFQPKIYYQPNRDSGGSKGKDLDSRGEAYLRGEEREYFYVDSNFTAMVKDLEKIDGIEEGERGKIRERLHTHWQNLMTAQLGELSAGLDDNLLRLRSPYPYESRDQEFWFRNLRKAVRKAREKDWAKEGEAKAWLDKVDIDITWGENNFRLLEGTGTVLPNFFNWTYMLNWVRERQRTDPISTFYELTFSKDVPGKSLPDEIKMLPEEKMRSSLREKAVQYQDDSIFWRMAVAAVGQADYDEYDEEKGPRTFMKLDPKEIEFIQKLFGGREEYVEYKGHKIPKSVLNWYSMAPSTENRREYLARMEALLIRGIRGRLKGGNVDELLSEVEKWVKERTENWFSSERLFESLLAEVVVKSGIVFDWGHMVAGQLGWGWKYKKKDGQIKREVESGATTAATDVFAPTFWRFQHAGNEKKAYPVGMLPPMSDKFRSLLEEKAPGWRPWLSENEEERKRKVKEETKKRLMVDPKLKAAWDRLWEGSWDPEAKTELQEMVWFWETPYKDGGEPIVIPFFFPPEISSLNFWNSISFEGKLGEKGVLSVWDELANGKKMSELKWQKMGDQALYRWMITISQTVRFLTVMLEPEIRANEDQFKGFFEHPGRTFELLKRINLGVRDEKTNLAILTMALMPMLVVLKTAGDKGIIGEGGYSKDNRTNWIELLVKWETMFSYLPKERDGIKGYGEGMVNLTQFYAALIARLGQVAGQQELEDAQKMFEKTGKALDKDVDIGLHKRGVKAGGQ